MAAYVVAARAIQFVVGSRGFLLEAGAAVPEGVAPEELARLAARGYIEPVATDEGIVEIDETVAEKPLDKMTKAELTELAQAEGIDLGAAKTKDDLVAVITAAREASSNPTSPTSPASAADPDESNTDESAAAGSDL